MKNDVRIALTGFMGVGKSSVSRHLAHITRCRKVDLDHIIEARTRRRIAQIIDEDGIDAYRAIETDNLKHVLKDMDCSVLSLGGGTFTIAENRDLLKSHGYTSVWLESTFEHCWLNIAFSRKDRPLARNKQKALELFEERQTIYCLADWHVIVRPDYTSFDVARNIADEMFT